MKKERTVTLRAVGDLMLGDHPVFFGHGIGSSLKKKRSDWLFAGVKEAWESTDIVFGNLETVLSRQGIIPDDLESCELRGCPSTIKSLVNAGFNVLNVANNHILQHGRDAFHETLEILRINQIIAIGLQSAEGDFHCHPEYYEQNGLRIGLLGYSFQKERYFDGNPLYAVAREQDILSDVRNLKEFVDSVVISLHWGDEFINRPSLRQIRLGRLLVDAGAHIIIGHHPHVLQGLEVYKNGIIAYSLGNFVSDMRHSGTRESVIFGCQISRNGVQDVEYVPVRINHDYQPQILHGSNGVKLRTKIRLWSDDLAREDFSRKAIKDGRYRRRGKLATVIYRLQCYLYFLTHIWKYEKTIILSSARRFIRRRLEIFGFPSN